MGNQPDTFRFLFVNKTSSSDLLTRSGKVEERSTILSHVQSRRRQKGRTRKTESWTRYASCILPASEKAPASPVEEEPQTGRREDTRSPSGSRTTCTSPRLPHTYPANNGADPFHCTVVGSDAYTHSLLHYTFACVAKRTFLAEAFALPAINSSRGSMRHAHIMNERLRSCVEDEMLMYSTLAYGSSCLAWSVGRIEENKTPEYFIGKAMQAVRIRLSEKNADQAPDTWLLLSVYALTITEFWSAMPEIWTKCPTRYASVPSSDKRSVLRTARIHMCALVRLVEDAGGWGSVDSYVLESSILADKYMALYEMTIPVIPLTWDPGSMSKARQDELQIQPHSTLPQLGKKLLKVPMCHKLAQAIGDVIDFARVAHCAWSHADRLTSLDENWLFLRHQALVYRLLALGDSLQTLDNCVRITTLLFLLNATEYHGAYVSARMTLQHLISALLRAKFWEEDDFGYGQGVVRWCICTGAMTLEPSRERDWFRGVLVRFYLSSSSVWTEDSFQEGLEPYLFLAVKQKVQLSGLIESLFSKTQV